jgi:hypothetical protein
MMDERFMVRPPLLTDITSDPRWDAGSAWRRSRNGDDKIATVPGIDARSSSLRVVTFLIPLINSRLEGTNSYSIPTNFMEQNPWEADGRLADQIPPLLWNSMVHYRVHKRPPEVTVLAGRNKVSENFILKPLFNGKLRLDIYCLLPRYGYSPGFDALAEQRSVHRLLNGFKCLLSKGLSSLSFVIGWSRILSCLLPGGAGSCLVTCLQVERDPVILICHLSSGGAGLSCLLSSGGSGSCLCHLPSGRAGSYLVCCHRAE